MEKQEGRGRKMRRLFVFPFLLILRQKFTFHASMISDAFREQMVFSHRPITNFC